MPNCALIREVRIIEEAISWLTMSNHAASVVTKGIVQKFLITPNVLTSIWGRVLSCVVDEHSWIQIGTNTLLEMLQSFTELSRIFRDLKQCVQCLSGNCNVAVIVSRIASVFTDSPLFFSAEKATAYTMRYR